MCKTNSQRGGLSLFALVIIFFVSVAVISVALRGWRDLYHRYLEKGAPVIVLDEQPPRGIGALPVSLKFTVADTGTGLDEVVVRSYQRTGSKEILRRTLSGDKEAKITVDFAEDKSTLEEGPLRIEIKAFDRSFWSNSAEQLVELVVDYRKPRVEPVTMMHNARRGGTQLVVYRAIDDRLAFSGVRVGSQTFFGFPARGIDPAFSDPTIFAALYAVDARSADTPGQIRIFAQDAVGNASSISFPNRVLQRSDRMTTVTLTEKFLAETISPLVTKSFSELQSFAREIGKPINLSGEAGTTSRLLEELNLVLGSLRTLNEQQLAGLLKKAGRLERYWKSPFLQQPGAVNSTFGERLNYTFGGKPIGTVMQSGYSFIMPRGSKVIAAADGVVIFSETLGTLGRVIGIDHGLGLVSIYGQLEAPLSREGDLVSAGQPIAISGSSGFARNNGAYFELRVHGVPVDPREWWDRSWFFGHVVEQIQAAKKLLEIPFEPVTEESF